jgi:hypothetical protein
MNYKNMKNKYLIIGLIIVSLFLIADTSNACDYCGTPTPNWNPIHHEIQRPVYQPQPVYIPLYPRETYQQQPQIIYTQPQVVYQQPQVIYQQQPQQVVYQYQPSPVVVSNNTSNANVVTKDATRVDKTSAVLNGTINNPYSYNMSGYFEYGNTVSLGSRTPTRSLGSQNTLNFNESISGLSEDTIYYYRAVSESSNGTMKGLIEIFATPGTPKVKTATVARTTTPVVKDDLVYIKVPRSSIAPVGTETQGSTLGASAFLSGFFVTGSLIWWLIVILLILLIALIGRMLFLGKGNATHVHNHYDPHSNDRH